MDAALDDDVCLDQRRLTGELERVAADVGNAVIDFRRLVVVRQNDSVALFFQAIDPVDVRRMHRPFDRGNVVLHLFVEMRRRPGDRRRIGKLGTGQNAEALGRCPIIVLGALVALRRRDGGMGLAVHRILHANYTQCEHI